MEQTQRVTSAPRSPETSGGSAARAQRRRVRPDPESSSAAHALTILAVDGFELHALRYEPDEAVRGVVLVHPATATPQLYYRAFATYLARNGYRVITYDYRGVGLSRGTSLRREKATMADWALLDARALHAYVREHYAPLPLAIVGHSFGGQLVGLIDEAREASAAIFVGVQLAYYKLWPSRMQPALSVLWKGIVPVATAVFDYLPGQLGLGVDLPAGVARQWARWCSHPEYFIGEHPHARERLARFDTPLLFFSFTDDVFAPRRAVANLLGRLPMHSVIHRRFAPGDLRAEQIGHFGFFRERFEDDLWKQALTFLDARLRSVQASLHA